jgi:cytidylate kinase
MSPVEPKRRIITVDGAAGSGKTTLGRRIAFALHLPFLDTGLFYRAVLVAAVRDGVAADNAESLTALASATNIEINTDPADTDWQVRVDGADAGPILRDPDLGPMLGQISQTPGVRAALLKPQRLAGANGAVAAGRDCGTVIFPNAAIKFFLEAPADVRTARRSAELALTRGAVGAETAERDVVARDAIDQPSMQMAPGAHVIDTSTMGIDQMVATALEICVTEGIVG